jgi:hypothetical protein
MGHCDQKTASPTINQQPSATKTIDYTLVSQGVISFQPNSARQGTEYKSYSDDINRK